MKISVSLWSADLLELGATVNLVAPHVDGLHIDPRIGERIKAIVSERDRRHAGAEIFVDGGIRRHTVPMLATAGADGVIPGSLVFANKDPCAAIGWIKSLGQKAEQALA
jgi:pentose-5-phosphate-3-epimerase